MNKFQVSLYSTEISQVNKDISILAVGDIHLGTTCSGLPSDISSWGIDPQKLTPAAALERAVDYAIEHESDAMLFAGDVVENTNARFEAMLPLEKSVHKLLNKGIKVIAVAGNHDVEALPRLATLINGFKLLGGDGQWEAHTLFKDESPLAQVIGWSFGESRVRQSPVAQLLAQPFETSSPPVPRIGLLHADLGASGGHYAPIKQSELDDTGYDIWLLGHIHKPSLNWPPTSASRRVSGYLGSLMGLDPSETGPHGPWLLTVSSNGKLNLEQIPLAPVRWECLEVSVNGLKHVEDVPDRILGEAEKYIGQLAQAGFPLLALGLRISLTGTSAQYEEIRAWIAGGEWQTISRNVNGTTVFLSKITDSMKLQLDLEEIAKADDPAALLAQHLLILENDDKGSATLLENARSELSKIASDSVWSPVQDHRDASDPLSDEALRDMLVRSGKAALNTMLNNT